MVVFLFNVYKRFSVFKRVLRVFFNKSLYYATVACPTCPVLRSCDKHIRDKTD